MFRKVIIFAVSLLLILSMPGCTTQEQEGPEYLSERLFSADFDRNYQILVTITKDVAGLTESSDPKVEGAVSFVRDELFYSTYPYHIASITTYNGGDTSFIPESVCESVDYYYQTYQQYFKSLDNYLQSNEGISENVKAKIQQLDDFLPTELHTLVKRNLFKLEAFEEAEVNEWLQTIADKMLAVVDAIELELS